MSLILVGLNHRSAPVELLERLAVPEARLPKALHDLSARDHLSETVVLSTCNRTEIYADCTRFHPAVDDVRSFFAEYAGVDADVFGEHLYIFFDDAVVAHLFGVAAGTDSMIVGEGEILGQVRDAWRAAEAEGTAGPLLCRAFRHAVEVGKRARTETAIGRHAVSVSSAAVGFAANRLGTLAGRSVLVLGAGEMGEGMARALVAAGADDVVVANRTAARAARVAERVGGRAIALHELVDELERVDLFLASTGADEMLVTRDDLEAVVERRGARPLLVVDVAVPRDVDPAVADLPGVTVLDIDDLKTFTNHSLDRRRNELEKVRTIIAGELDRYRDERSARAVAPLVAALRERAESIRAGELQRFRNRLDGLDASARAAVEALTEGIVNKLLHEPTVRVKDTAGTSRGELLADALQSLFALPDDAPPDDAPPDGDDPAG